MGATNLPTTAFLPLTDGKTTTTSSSGTKASLHTTTTNNVQSWPDNGTTWTWNHNYTTISPSTHGTKGANNPKIQLLGQQYMGL